MINYNEKTVEKYMRITNDESLFKISWTLTETGQTVIKSIFKNQPQSLLELAKIANQKFDEFCLEMKKKRQKVGDVLIFDDFDQDVVMPNILKMNGVTEDL